MKFLGLIPIPGTKNFDKLVEVIEERHGSGEYTWFTMGREVWEKPANTKYYEIQGIKHRIKAPDYRHIARTRKGDLIRIYSPADGEYRIMELKKTDKAAVLEPLFAAGDRDYEDTQIKKSHEDYTKKSWQDKYLLFIMIMVTALIFIIGQFLTLGSLQKVSELAAASSASYERGAGAFAEMTGRWDKLIGRLDLLLEKYGIDNGTLNGTITPPPPV